MRNNSSDNFCVDCTCNKKCHCSQPCPQCDCGDCKCKKMYKRTTGFATSGWAEKNSRYGATMTVTIKLMMIILLWNNDGSFEQRLEVSACPDVEIVRTFMEERRVAGQVKSWAAYWRSGRVRARYCYLNGPAPKPSRSGYNATPLVTGVTLW